MSKIGVDLGGTKIEGILLDDNFKIIERKRIPTIRNYKKIVESIVELVKELTKKTTELSTIGVCTPGFVSEKTGLLQNSNTQCLTGMPLKNDLEKILGQKILMENDANCFALAESALGAAKNYDVVFGIIMGTGVGGGIIMHGDIVKGKNHIAGEWGHHILRPGGNKCYCGKNGCIETYISGPSLEKRWKELTGKNESLQNITNFSDKNEKQWKIEFLENFSLGISNVINILDPDVIVLGGGVSNISFLYDEGINATHEKILGNVVKTPVLKNKLGDSAGVFGACLL